MADKSVPGDTALSHVLVDPTGAEAHQDDVSSVAAAAMAAAHAAISSSPMQNVMMNPSALSASISAATEANMLSSASPVAAARAAAAAAGASDDLELREVKAAMREAVAVFNKVKSEKMTSEGTPVSSLDQVAYQGVAKEIVDKAIKQKERERANRASAAASRNKVMRYQTELENRLNRVEAERNAYRKQCAELKLALTASQASTEAIRSDLSLAHAWMAKLQSERPEVLTAVLGKAQVDAFMARIGTQNETPATKKARRV